jgi:hypothetical protein
METVKICTTEFPVRDIELEGLFGISVLTKNGELGFGFSSKKFTPYQKKKYLNLSYIAKQVFMVHRGEITIDEIKNSKMNVKHYPECDVKNCQCNPDITFVRHIKEAK